MYNYVSQPVSDIPVSKPIWKAEKPVGLTAIGAMLRRAAIAAVVVMGGISSHAHAEYWPVNITVAPGTVEVVKFKSSCAAAYAAYKEISNGKLADKCIGAMNDVAIDYNDTGGLEGKAFVYIKCDDDETRIGNTCIKNPSSIAGPQCEGNPIEVMYGRKVEYAVDFSIGADHPLVLRRVYAASGADPASSLSQRLGLGWDYDFLLLIPFAPALNHWDPAPKHI